MRPRLSLLIFLLCAICVFVECDLERRDVHRIILKGKSKKSKKNRPKKPQNNYHHHEAEHLQGSVEYFGFNENEALPSNQFGQEFRNQHHYHNSRDKGRIHNHHYHGDNYKQSEEFHGPIKPVHKYNENYHELMSPKHKHNEDFFELMKPRPHGPENYVIGYPEEVANYENQGLTSTRHNVPVRPEIAENWSPMQYHQPQNTPKYEEYGSQQLPTSAAPKKKKTRKQTTEMPQKSTKIIDFTTSHPFKYSQSPSIVTEKPQHLGNHQNYFRNNNNHNSSLYSIKSEASHPRPLKAFPPILNPERLQAPQSSYEVYESFEDSRPPKHQILHNLAPAAPTVFSQLSHTQKYPPGVPNQPKKNPFRGDQPLKYSSGEIRDEYRNKYSGNYGMRTQPGRNKAKEQFRYT